VQSVLAIRVLENLETNHLYTPHLGHPEILEKTCSVVHARLVVVEYLHIVACGLHRSGRVQHFLMRDTTADH